MYIFSLLKRRPLLQRKAAVLGGKASLWHVRASYPFFGYEGGQVPVGKGKHGLNAGSYKIGKTPSTSGRS